MGKTSLIIAREYRERTKKKSFIIATILMPLFMIGLMVAPSLVMMLGKTDTKHIVVVDDTPGQIIGSRLASNSEVEFQLLDGMTKEQAYQAYDTSDKAFGILYIGRNIEENYNDVSLVTNTSASVSIEENIRSQIEQTIRNRKIEQTNIPGIDSILASTQVRLGSLQTLKNNGSDNIESMEETSTDASMLLGLVMGLLLYMILIIYGQMVMTSVIEEKQSRVIDVMVTSCTPFELMSGKIIGVAAVAATQIAIWAVLVIGASKFLLPVLMDNTALASAGAVATGINATLGNVLFMVKLFTYLLFYIIGGFILYSSLFAAVGSAVDTAQDAGQFNTIIMMPIILAIIVMMQVFNDANSPLIMWFSMIPFTSPIVMMARIPFDIPVWQPLVSLAILYASVMIAIWLAGKVYRIGIFMHGKKPTWKDLLLWIKTK